MQLTQENYFSPESNMEYMGSTQYKNFRQCEAMGLAYVKGLWDLDESNALLQGKYVHAWNESKLDQFKEANPQMLKRDGSLKAEFLKCNEIIEMIEQDKLFMMALAGEKEVIFTAELFGTKWKILIDSYFEKAKRFGDLKILKSLDDKFWNKELQLYENVFEYRGYYTQSAIYAAVERAANKRDEYFEPFIAVATKEKYPDKAIIGFISDQETHTEFIERELLTVEKNMPRILDVKSGKVEARRCEVCDYCKSTKKLTGTIHYSELNLY